MAQRTSAASTSNAFLLRSSEETMARGYFEFGAFALRSESLHHVVFVTVSTGPATIA